jgi:hypothetical protein
VRRASVREGEPPRGTLPRQCATGGAYDDNKTPS